jgi:hypothetical protein
VLEEAVRRGRQAGSSLVEITSTVWERSDLTGQEAMALSRTGTEAVRRFEGVDADRPVELAEVAPVRE